MKKKNKGYYNKQAMSRCLSFISKSKTFFDLSIKFKDIFLFYIEKILNQKLNLNFYASEINKTKNSKQADFIPICYLINTCDYCIYQNNISYDMMI